MKNSIENLRQIRTTISEQIAELHKLNKDPNCRITTDDSIDCDDSVNSAINSLDSALNSIEAAMRFYGVK